MVIDVGKAISDQCDLSIISIIALVSYSLVEYLIVKYARLKKIKKG